MSASPRAQSGGNIVAGAAEGGKCPRRSLCSELPDESLLRASPRPLRVLPARWRVQDRPPRRACRGVRPTRPRADRPRRHERCRRVVHRVPQARHQADPRLRGVRRRRPRPAGPGPARPLPPHASGRHPDRLPKPGQAVLGGLPRGLSARQAIGRPRPDRRPRRGCHRPDRMPAIALLPVSPRRASRRRARACRPAAVGVRSRQRVLRGAEERPRAPGPGQRGHRADRTRGGAAVGRDGGRPLPPSRGLPPSRCAPVRADQVDAQPAQDQLRHQRVLSALERGDGQRRSPSGPRRWPRRSRLPSVATCRSSSTAS